MLLALETFYAILTLPLSLQRRGVRVLTLVSFSFPPPSQNISVAKSPLYWLSLSFLLLPTRGKGSSSFPRNTFSWCFCSPRPLVFSTGSWSISTFVISAFCSPNQNVQIYPICSHCTRHYAKCCVRVHACVCVKPSLIVSFDFPNQPLRLILFLPYS